MSRWFLLWGGCAIACSSALIAHSQSTSVVTQGAECFSRLRKRLTARLFVACYSTGVELCQVHIEDFSQADKQAHKCIIMARFYRAADGQWAVQAVSSLCQGNTADYESMVDGCMALPARP